MIEQLVGFLQRPPIVAVGGTLLLVLAGLAGRRIYARLYLNRRLFFDPWVNLSNDESLNIGSSLAELLYFELESLKELLVRARSTARLWNERLELPQIDRLFEGYPDFVRQVESLGLPGRVGAVFRFVLAVTPRRIHGSIHRFGDKIRLQVMLEGGTRQASTSPRGKAVADGETPRNAGRVAWAREVTAHDRDALPAALKSIAHEIALDLSGIRSFKSAESFVHFTNGLREHLAFIELRGRKELALVAAEHYSRSIQAEERNPYASYAKAQILYSSYQPDDNMAAISLYKDAL